MGGILVLLGTISLEQNNIVFFPPLVVGLSVLLDSSVVFGLQNPDLIQPIPPNLAYAGLVVFSVGSVLWTSAVVFNWGFWPVDIAFVTFLSGGIGMWWNTWPN